MTNREVNKGLLKSGGLKPAFGLSFPNVAFVQENKDPNRELKQQSLFIEGFVNQKKKHDHSIVIMVSTSVRKLIRKTTDGPHSVNDTMLVVSKEHKQVKTKHKIQNETGRT